MSKQVYFDNIIITGEVAVANNYATAGQVCLFVKGGFRHIYYMYNILVKGTFFFGGGGGGGGGGGRQAGRDDLSAHLFFVC